MRLWLVLGLMLVVGGCQSCQTDEGRLFSRCEVYLEELSRPAIGDLWALTEPIHPDAACELHLFNHDSPADRSGFQIVERSRWSLECQERDGRWEDCELELDSSLLATYDDGVLVCSRGNGDGECEPEPGTRTLCSLSGTGLQEVASGAMDDGDGAPPYIVAVDGFGSADPGLAAVTWARNRPGSGASPIAEAHVRFARTGPDGLSVGPDVDLCAELEQDGSSRGPFLLLQTATHEDAVLLPAPCGPAAVVMARSDGSRSIHPVVGRSSAPEHSSQPLDAALAVMDLAAFGGEGTYAVLWTDGRDLFANRFSVASDRDSLDQEQPELVWENDATRSREDPSAVCFFVGSMGTDSRSGACRVLWTERSELPRGSEPPQDDLHGDALRLVQVGSGSWEPTWMDDRSGVAPGSRGQFVMDHRQPDAPQGVFVALDPSGNGLLARAWHRDRPTVEPQGNYALLIEAAATQLAPGHGIEDFSLVSTLDGRFVAAWVEESPDTGEPELALTCMDVRESPDHHLVQTVVGVDGFPQPSDGNPRGLPDGPSQRPLLAMGAGAEGAPIMLVGARQQTETCSYQLGLAEAEGLSHLPEEGDWPYEVTLPLVTSSPVIHVPSTTDCEADCSGAALWVGDQFLVAVPTDGGIGLHLVSETSSEQVDFPALEGTALEGPACRIALRMGNDDQSVLLAHDHAGQPELGIELRLLRLDPSGTDLQTDEVLAQVAWAAAPTFATTEWEMIVLLWTSYPFGSWDQHDVGLGFAVPNEDGTFAFEPIELPYANVVDSRPVAAVGLPTPCALPGIDQDPCWTTWFGEGLCATMAVTRPDPREVGTFGNWSPDLAYSPQTEIFVASVFDPPEWPDGANCESTAARCPLCNHVELMEGTTQRGLVSDLAVVGTTAIMASATA